MIEFYYRISPKDHSYAEVEPMEFTNDLGYFRLHGESMKVQVLSEKYNRESAARELTSYLKAWELEASLQHGFRVISFKPAEGDTVPLKADSSVHDNGTVLIFSWNHYPNPPVIKVSPELEEIWNRYTEARIGIGEPLQSAVYYALTVFERLAGGRREASELFKIDPRILRRLGELTSNRSTHFSRKYLKGANPLTRPDLRWIDRALRLCLFQFGCVNAGIVPNMLRSEAVGE